MRCLTAWRLGIAVLSIACALIVVVGVISFHRTAQLRAASLSGLAAVLGLILAAIVLMHRAANGRQREHASRITSDAIAAAVFQSEERLRVTIESIGDAVIATDDGGRVTLLNGAARALTAWSAADAIGRALQDVFVIINEVSREPAPNPVERVLREGVIAALANHTALISKDGREIPIDDSAAPIVAPDGRVVGAVLVFRDVSERREAERQRAALLEQERRARADAERVNERLRHVQAITDSALDNLAFRDLLRQLMTRVRLALGNETATVLLLEPDGRYLRSVASDGLREEIGDESRVPVGRGIAGRIATSGEGLIFDDLAGVDVESGFLREHVKSLVGAPLRIGERLIGVIHVGAVAPHRFTSDDLQLLRLVAERAAVAVERARLYAAEQAARTQADLQRREAEVLADLARATSASLDLDIILTRVADAARELLGTDRAAVALRDPATGRMVVRYRAGSRLHPEEPIAVEPGRGVGGHVLISGKPFRTADVLSDPRLSLRHPEYFQGEGIAAMLVVPMRIDDRIEGLLYASHRSHRIFTDRDEAMLTRLADQVAVAIRDRQLFAAEQAARAAAESAARRASFFAEASELLAASLDYETRLTSLARLTIPQVCDLCIINLLDDDGAIRRAAAAHVDPDKEVLVRELQHRFRIDPSGPHPVAKVLRTGVPEIAPEIPDAVMATIASDAEHRTIAEALGYRSYIVVPLVARGSVLGCISFVSGPSGRRYGSADLALAEELARRAALSVDNARLYRHSETVRAGAEAAEQRLWLALDAGRMGTWEWTMATGAVRWSSSLEAIHGFEPGTFPGTFEALQNEIHPDDRDRVLRAISGAVAERRDHQVEYRIVRRDGAVRWVEGRGQLFYDAAGRPERMVGVCADITDRKQTEERFRLAIEAAPTAMVMVDRRGTIRLVNALVEPVFGYAREELLGQSIERLVPPRFRDRHSEDRGSFFAAPHRRAMGEGRDLYAVRSDGTEVPVEIGLSPVETADGVFVLAAVTDITERKRLEQRQAIQHAVTHVLAEALTLEDVAPRVLEAVGESLGWGVAAFWTVDRETAVQRCVDVWHRPSAQLAEFEAVIRGWTFAPGVGLLGRVWVSGESVWIPDALEDDNFPRGPFAARAGLRGALAFPIRLGRDVLGMMEFFSREIRQPDRELLAMMATVGSQVGQFIERRRAEEERAQLLLREQAARREAETANRAKDEFLAMLSHELRTPLNTVLGWTRMLRSKTLDEAAAARALDVIERNARAQATLVDDLLDISRIVRGDVRLDLRPVDLSSIVEAAVDAVRATAKAKGLALHCALDHAMGRIVVDANRLQQIVGNLLTNAIKFTPAGGHIRLRLERAGTSARITVTDTGIGISPDLLPWVFDRFRQGQTAREHGGLGIGLAIVRQMVELHGGTVVADSAGEGQGATFTVVLPWSASE